MERQNQRSRRRRREKPLFETIYVTLEAHINGNETNYTFTRKVEDQIKIKKDFTDLDELFIYSVSKSLGSLRAFRD